MTQGISMKDSITALAQITVGHQDNIPGGIGVIIILYNNNNYYWCPNIIPIIMAKPINGGGS